MCIAILYKYKYWFAGPTNTVDHLSEVKKTGLTKEFNANKKSDWPTQLFLSVELSSKPMGQEQIAPTLLMVHLCVQPPLPIEHVDGESTKK